MAKPCVYSKTSCSMLAGMSEQEVDLTNRSTFLQLPPYLQHSNTLSTALQPSKNLKALYVSDAEGVIEPMDTQFAN